MELNRKYLEDNDLQNETDLSENDPLDSKGFMTIHPDTFKESNHLFKLSISWNNITKIHPSTFATLENLKELYLLENQLTLLDQKTFDGLKNLRVLSLSGNKLTKLHFETLSKLTNLREFYLSGNNVKLIDSRTFKGLTNLERIFLNENQITTIQEKAFNGLVNLKELNISLNNLSGIDAGLFRHLENLRVLSLSYNRLKFLDSTTFECLKNIRELYLYQNQIVNLNPKSFNSLHKIEILSLSNNQLTGIDVTFFDGLVNLKEIYLSGNQISFVDPETFNSLINLRKLYINSNQLSRIDPKTFKGLSKLEIISLTQNKLVSIDPSTFQGLANIKAILLDGNIIEELDPSTFAGLDKLEMLSLNENQIESIDPDTFKNLTSLKTLYLNENNLSYIDPETFDGLDKLEFLNLRKNNISSIHSETFVQLTNLKELNLSGNVLTQIEANTFAGLTKLENLYLRKNCLKNIDKDLFRELINLKELELGINQLSYLDKITFISQSKLKKLYLNDNQFKAIDTTSFIRLHNLEILSLSNNQISHIDSILFMNLLNLKELSLYENKINSIHSTTFQRLTHLRALYLNENQISHLDQNMFKNLKELKELYLHNNIFNKKSLELFIEKSVDIVTFSNSDKFFEWNGTKMIWKGRNEINDVVWPLNNQSLKEYIGDEYDAIEGVDLSARGGILSINNNTFDDLERITYLNLSNSHITHLDKKTFKHLKFLKVLDLRWNNIKSIDIFTFSSLINLEKLSLYGNPNQIDVVLMFREIFSSSNKSLSLNPLEKCPITYLNYLVHQQEIDCCSKAFRFQKKLFDESVNFVANQPQLKSFTVNHSTVIDLIIEDDNYSTIFLKELFEIYETEKRKILDIENLDTKFCINNKHTFKKLIQRENIFILNLCLKENQNTEVKIYKSLNQYCDLAIERKNEQAFNCILSFVRNQLKKSYENVILSMKNHNIQNRHDLESKIIADFYAAMSEEVLEENKKMKSFVYKLGDLKDFGLYDFILKVSKKEWWNTLEYILDFFEFVHYEKSNQICPSIKINQIKFLTFNELEFFEDPAISLNLWHMDDKKQSELARIISISIDTKLYLFGTDENEKEKNEEAKEKEDDDDDDDDLDETQRIEKQMNKLKQEQQKEYSNPMDSYPLFLICKSGQKRLIKHEVTKTLLEKKWRKFGGIFYYSNLLLYALFLLTYSINGELGFSSTSNYVHQYTWPTFFFAFLLLIVELFQLVSQMESFLTWENIIEGVNFLCCLISLSIPSQLGLIKSGLYSVTILVCYFLFLTKLEKIQLWDVGLYVYVFKSCLSKSIRLFAILFIVIFGFCISLRIQSNGQISDAEIQNFITLNSSFQAGVLQISNMLIGNMESFSEMNVSSDNMANYIVTMLFIFLMPIFLYDLITGLAIGEINDVLKDAEIKTVQIRIEYVLKIQRLVESIGKISKKLKKASNIFKAIKKFVIFEYDIHIVGPKPRFYNFKQKMYSLFGFFYSEFIDHSISKEFTFEDLKIYLDKSDKFLKSELNLLKDEIKTVKFDVQKSDLLNKETDTVIRDLKITVENLAEFLNNRFDRENEQNEIEYIKKEIASIKHEVENLKPKNQSNKNVNFRV